MRLLLLRHGEAGYDAPSDEQRSLTDHGWLRVQQMLKQQSGTLAGLERIVHSPYLRTQQTAALVLAQQPANSIASPLLTPEASPETVLDWLAEQSDEVLMLVTHQPLIGLLVSRLCEGDYSRPEPMLPGALAVIDLTFPAAGLGRLQSLMR
ncbi:phosphohistidine phosphatase SixA [Amphritea opalescens]|uniref:Phosphohistidine phosphatase SixA n=1 Tax=Amphritea opalescens TaxID=2490544 RepID=A0A430KW37_9GAMM|nr:phosphohistidine phosphatase SixA [Amphritea opalescens]RTE67676.1 phosphohistidine phosphatase SixA [Amphritea opalescens]